LWYDAFDKVVLSLNLDERVERPKGIPNEHPQFLFVTSEDKFFGKKEEENDEKKNSTVQ
jgi:hypothetical protein